jgi:hypothetical protein
MVMSEDKNSLLFWFPKIRDLGVPYPKTEIVPFLEEYGTLFDYLEGKPLSQELIAELEAKATSVGFPLFMRTDLLSGKHSYEDWLPYVESKEQFPHKVLALMEASVNADLFGVPLNAFVLREFLELDYQFRAFGGMPIAKERRYFIKDGKTICHHPYWPIEAIRFYGEVKEPAGWQDQLRELNVEPPEEVALLSNYATNIAEVLKGFWSVDFAHSSHGIWYFIDAALGKESWHWAGCKYKLTKDPHGS